MVRLLVCGEMQRRCLSMKVDGKRYIAADAESEDSFISAAKLLISLKLRMHTTTVK